MSFGMNYFDGSDGIYNYSDGKSQNQVKKIFPIDITEHLPNMMYCCEVVVLACTCSNASVASQHKSFISFSC